MTAASRPRGGSERANARAGFARLLRGGVAALICFSIGGADMSAPASAREIGRSLTLQDRIDAQRAIERVYYAHQVGATRPFEEVASGERLRRKVLSYLKESVALETVWGTPVSSEALRRELDRIAKNTRFPERLEEIYAALDHDPILVTECFVRPVLVRRLTRSFFSTDQRIQAEARARAESLQAAVMNGREPGRPGSQPVTREFSRGDRGRSGASGDGRSDEVVELEPERFDRLLQGLPGQQGSVSNVIEQRHQFVVRQVLERSSDAVQVRDYSVAKRIWESWWMEVEASFDEDLIQTAVPPVGALPQPATHSPHTSDGFEESAVCAPTDYWDNGSLDDEQTARARHTAVWTGTEMFVWGGEDNVGLVTQGEAYDPLTDTWRAISTTNSPSARVNHVSVWTGSEIIVWGGLSLNTGGRYRPATDDWLPMSTTGAPVGRSESTAVWTGSKMVVWGGRADLTPLNSGGRYDPSSDSWTATSLAGAPTARANHTTIWTGTSMVVWGGGSYLNTGGRYDPVSDTWTATATLNAAQGRTFHAAVWIGNRMVVWGGANAAGFDLNTGGRYDPVTNVWTATSTTGAPGGRLLPTMLWTGSDVVIWGGQASVGPVGYGTGGRYDPVSDSWRSVTLANSPGLRFEHSSVWTGSLVVVWGGSGDLGELVVGTGGRYDPVADRWTPISPPGYRDAFTAAWTGNVMIIWGGVDNVALDTGGRYDPLTDSWAETSLWNAPTPRFDHTAVWTGGEMLVWGGRGGGQDTNTGGRYDPVTDSWLPTSLAGAPSPRRLHVAIWTGAEMIAWGGRDATVLGSGGRYDPATDTWTPINLAGAPAPRSSHTAVWTGGEMLVWGGIDTSGARLSTGGLLDPTADVWSATSSFDAPASRSSHTAIWTGTRMIVWGGNNGTTNLTTGGQYDPVLDVWRPTATAGAPPPSAFHVAVFTGRDMIVWGGRAANGNGADTGGRYDPVLDAWSPTTTVGAPPRIESPKGVWAGGAMLVWGGEFDGSNFQRFDRGGRYFPGADSSSDLDQDTVSVCRNDCDDGSASAWSTPGEARNLDFALDGMTLSWSEPWYPGGAAIVYDILRSSLAPDFTVADCVQGDSANRVATDTVIPPPDGVLYYFVRAENGCPGGLSQGPLGFDSTGTLRSGRNCP